MDMADERVRVLHSVDHMQVIEAKNGPTSPHFNFPHCNTAFAASLS